MKIEVAGTRCVTCTNYYQFYTINRVGEVTAINIGFCTKKQKHTEPAKRCKEYKAKNYPGLTEMKMMKAKVLEDYGIKPDWLKL